MPVRLLSARPINAAERRRRSVVRGLRSGSRWIYEEPGREVIEVDRPNRQARRRNGKNDEPDAVEAARRALSGRVSGHAKAGVGNVEALRVLLIAKCSAWSQR